MPEEQMEMGVQNAVLPDPAFPGKVVDLTDVFPVSLDETKTRQIAVDIIKLMKG
jgi:hypothetical protein